MIAPHDHRSAGSPRCAWLAPTVTAALKYWSYQHYKLSGVHKHVEHKTRRVHYTWQATWGGEVHFFKRLADALAFASARLSRTRAP